MNLQLSGHFFDSDKISMCVLWSFAQSEAFGEKNLQFVILVSFGFHVAVVGDFSTCKFKVTCTLKVLIFLAVMAVMQQGFKILV